MVFKDMLCSGHDGFGVSPVLLTLLENTCETIPLYFWSFSFPSLGRNRVGLSAEAMKTAVLKHGNALIFRKPPMWKTLLNARCAHWMCICVNVCMWKCIHTRVDQQETSHTSNYQIFSNMDIVPSVLDTYGNCFLKLISVSIIKYGNIPEKPQQKLFFLWGLKYPILFPTAVRKCYIWPLCGKQ